MSKPKFKVGDRVVITGTNVPDMKIGIDAVGKIAKILAHYPTMLEDGDDFSETNFDYIVRTSSSIRLYVNVREATAMDEVLCDEL